MYPAIRLAKEFMRFRNAPRLAMGEAHETTLRVWPWDVDVFAELNNGRALTLGDLARIVMFHRMGVTGVMKRERWYGTVAGTVVRYRRRVPPMAVVDIRTRVIGWDDRFTYVDQSMWRGGECASQAIVRAAVADRNGIVPTDRLADAMGLERDSPPLPDWVAAWTRAEDMRPWPPER